MDELDTYRAQLKQVQVALQADPNSSDLKKLESDLQEVIRLQTQLSAKEATGGWKAGQQCEAVWAGDGKYYAAVIDSVSADGNTATVTYTEYAETAEVKTSSLRHNKDSSEKEKEGKEQEKELMEGALPPKAESEKQKAKEEREKKKARNLKRKQKEEEKEKTINTVQNKWQNFQSGKGVKKTSLSAKPKKSIFASPDSIDGKVGVGTCGIGGKKMTEYQNRGKWHFEKGEGEE
eukprot:m.320716 g.320716  ORF g.320716 m.320716 type:complete len:234 (+) comp24368_c0_seq1:167-868(+)